MNFPWPEKIALFLLGAECLLIFLLGITSPTVFTPEWYAAGPLVLRIPLLTVTPIWLVLRFVDFLTGGPMRRSRITVYPPN